MKNPLKTIDLFIVGAAICVVLLGIAAVLMIPLIIGATAFVLVVR